MLPKTEVELEEVRLACRKLVTRSSFISGAVGWVPFINVGADIALLTELINKINRKFGLSKEQIEELPTAQKAEIFGVISGAGSTIIGKAVTKNLIVGVLKRLGISVTSKAASSYVPVVGSAAAIGISFAAMRHVGNSHLEDCVEVARRLLGEAGEAKTAPA